MLVMKFGGTSVECAQSISRAAQIVRERLVRQPIVIVSALAGVTDQLYSIGLLSREGRIDEAQHNLSELKARHTQVVRQLVTHSAARERLEQALEPIFAEANVLAKSIAGIQELTPRAQDRLLSLGERLSSRLVTEAFCAEGIPAVLVEASDVIITDAQHTEANPLMDLIADRTSCCIRPLVENGQVPIVGGFIGATEAGVPTTLGRGGSDFSASIVGASLDAERVEIWTDVNGLMTADPRICGDAQNIDAISFCEAAELAHFGAKVLHPRTLQPAVERGIPVYILNSRNPQSCGTRVEVGDSDGAARVRSIACKRGIVLAEIHARQGLDAKLTAAILEAVEREKCFFELAAISRLNLSLLMTSSACAEALARSLAQSASVRVFPEQALVSIVGRNVARNSAICAQALSALHSFATSMIFHGASDMNLSFVVDERQADEVVRMLHRSFFPSRDQSVGLSDLIASESVRLREPIREVEA